MKTKICGITRIEDAEAAAEAGAWAIGLNHAPESPRFIEAPVAEEIGAMMRRRLEIAGVFVNAPLPEVVRAAERAQLTLVQLHGEEGPSFCAEVNRRTGCPVIKAFRVSSPADVTAARAFHVAYVLYDAFSPKRHGGTGEKFDWELVGRRRRGGSPVLLAGGLTPDNVAEAISAARPWGVDVAGGVELEPGIKDPNRIVSFIAAANRAGDLEKERGRVRREVARARRAQGEPRGTR